MGAESTHPPMPGSSHSLALIVPTKDRRDSLRRLLASLEAQSSRPDQVIIVNAGTEDCKSLAGEFPRLKISYLYCPGSSAAAARNVGVVALAPDIELVGFMDDDNVLDPGVLEAMISFWRNARADVGGAGFNIQYGCLGPQTNRERASRLGLWPYRRFQNTGGIPGSVPRSGFPRRYYPVAETIEVEWLDTFAAVLRREVVEQFKFDEFFAGYSYLEFLDYTYAISRKYRLYVLNNACVINYNSAVTRSYTFGRKQVINRIHFVRKHHQLSLWRCWLLLIVQALCNLARGIMARSPSFFKRGLGNCAGLAQAALGRVHPVPGQIR